MKHDWQFASSRPTLDPAAVVAHVFCLRCSSKFNLEMMRSEVASGTAPDPPPWKNVEPDCDVAIVSEMMET